MSSSPQHDAEQIIKTINEIFVDEFELDAGAVVPTADLRADLDLDSLDGVDLVIALETAFNFRIDGKLIAEMRTVADIHTYVHTLVDSPESVVVAQASLGEA